MKMILYTQTKSIASEDDVKSILSTQIRFLCRISTYLLPQFSLLGKFLIKIYNITL